MVGFFPAPRVDSGGMPSYYRTYVRLWWKGSSFRALRRGFPGPAPPEPDVGNGARSVRLRRAVVSMIAPEGGWSGLLLPAHGEVWGGEWCDEALRRGDRGDI